MPRNFDLINKPICFKRNVLEAFETKNCTKLFVSNWINRFALNSDNHNNSKDHVSGHG